MVKKVTSINNMYKGKFPIWNRHPEIKLIMAPRFVRIALNKNILTNFSFHKKASTHVSTLWSTAWSSIMRISIDWSLRILGLINSIATWSHRLIHEVQTSSTVSTLGIDKHLWALLKNGCRFLDITQIINYTLWHYAIYTHHIHITCN